MRNQPNRDYFSNDEVQTPLPLARALVRHFPISGHVLEPCCGEGNIVEALLEEKHKKGNIRHIETFDTIWDKRGCNFNTDFLLHQGRADEIFTNPPWSKIRQFLDKAFEVADSVTFICTLNHAVGLKARNRLMVQHDFGIEEIVLLDTPRLPWPQSGFQLSAIRWVRGYHGDIKWTDLQGRIDYALS